MLDKYTLILNEYNKTHNKQQVSNNLNIPFSTVCLYLRKAGITNLNSPTDENLVISKIKNGLDAKQIAQETNLKLSKVYYIAKKYNLHFIRKYKYYIDESIFNTIDSEEKAYWLGFLYADGYISKDKSLITLTLSSKDREHLIKFANFLKTNSPIRDYKVKGNRGTLTKESYNASSINIYSNIIKNDLITLGCVNKKSLILTFPKEKLIPKEFIRHFIRGYFDGDGSVFISHEHHWRNQTLTNVIHWRFIGTLNMLENIKKQINIPIGVISKVKKASENTYELAYKRTKWAQTFYNYLYKDSTIYLDRKRQIFNLFFKKDAQRL